MSHSPEINSGFLSPSIGYLRITGLSDDVDSVGQAADKAVERLSAYSALVVDIRDNRGGSDRGAKAIADRFADHRRLFMTASVRTGKRRDELSTPIEWYIEPGGPRQYSGPVILLINRDTFSAGETLALAMRVLPGVIMGGEPTAGAFSDANDAVLPNGWRLMYSIGVWRDSRGNLWEGKGLPPDVLIHSSPQALADGVDPAIDWAVQHLTGNVPIRPLHSSSELRLFLQLFDFPGYESRHAFSHHLGSGLARITCIFALVDLEENREVKRFSVETYARPLGPSHLKK